MSSIAKNEKTSPKLAFGYGMGEVANQISWYMINTYLTIFYTDAAVSYTHLDVYKRQTL